MISLVALFIIFAAVIGTGAMVSILAYFLNRIRQLESTATVEPGSHRLEDDVRAMREELLTVQDEMSALTERLDFTEKLLMSGDDAAASGNSEGSE